MSGAFWCDVAADFLGGAAAGLVILLLAEEVFSIRKQAKRREEERHAAVNRALKYLDLIEEEIGLMVKGMPWKTDQVKSNPWGKHVALATPVWDVVQQGGELARLWDPRLLKAVALFYALHDRAAKLVDWLANSWLVDEAAVAEIDEKRTECIEAIADSLKVAEKRGMDALQALDVQRSRLAGQEA